MEEEPAPRLLRVEIVDSDKAKAVDVKGKARDLSGDTSEQQEGGAIPEADAAIQTEKPTDGDSYAESDHSQAAAGGDGGNQNLSAVSTPTGYESPTVHTEQIPSDVDDIGDDWEPGTPPNAAELAQQEAEQAAEVEWQEHENEHLLEFWGDLAQA